jgi:hypothetical protein
VEFLASCVRSALHCADPEIEIIVSDNASTDGTREVVAAMPDTRLVYVNPGERVPMHDNFEFALAKTSGRYLMFIGDDDAVLPGRIPHLLKLLRAEQPDAVNWQIPGYVWPGAANGTSGVLTLKPSHLRGGRTERNARETLQSLAGGSTTSFRFGGAKLYHGCVAKRVVDKVIARAGRYFFVPWPDVGAAIANLFVSGNIVVLGQPCTLAGESRASNGWSQRFLETHGGGEKNPHMQFVDENLKQVNANAIDSRIRPISALTFVTLAETIRRMGPTQGVTLNSRAWLPMLESELASVPEPARSQQADIIDASLDAIRAPRLDRAWSRKDKHKGARVRPPIRRNRLLPNRMCIVSRPEFCANVYEAALLMDHILGHAPDLRPRSNLAVSTAWAGALARAAGVVISRHRPSMPIAPLQRPVDGHI